MYKVGDEVLVKGRIKQILDNGVVVYCDCGEAFIHEAYSDVLITVDKTYEQGLADAWDLARKIVCAKGFNMDELDVIFGKRTADGVLKKYTAEEAIAKISEYERKKEIKVGDEVRMEDGSTYWIIAINDYCIFGYASGKNDICFPVQKLEGLNLTKTGRTTDAIDLLRQIGE